ncbi:MAG: class I SAM-dependent methyltransferase [Syntrophales bacterium]|nr:class I SAM-dependent methyltransferase [Syntrophales bacterium]
MRPQRRQSNLGFRLMSLGFRIRDGLSPPIKMLQEAGIRSGMTVLDFGCGPGSFSMAASRLVGSEGLVYALDNHPLALETVRRNMNKKGFKNILPLSGEDLANVPNESIDMALLYDVVHDLSDPCPVLTELQRVMKPNGALSIRDHHLKEGPLVSRITSSGFFRFTGSNRGVSRFVKAGKAEMTSS